MSFVYRKFFVCFNQIAAIIIYLLPKTLCDFRLVNFLYITGTPMMPAFDIQPITASAVWQFLPLAEFLLILVTRAH